jgi:CubicO group peptidase (beta-lactamase class C family)
MSGPKGPALGMTSRINGFVLAAGLLVGVGPVGRAQTPPPSPPTPATAPSNPGGAPASPNPAAPPAAPIPYQALKSPDATPGEGAGDHPRFHPKIAGATAKPAVPAPAGARLAPTDPLPAPELETFIDGVTREAMARDHIAGVTVSVVQNGQVLLQKGYGVAGLSPWRAVDPQKTLFRLGPVSRIFTWILVMGEVESGRMRFDGPVNLYLPERLRLPDQGFAHPIRVLDLVNQTDGLEVRDLGQSFERDPARVRPMDQYLAQERPSRVRDSGALVVDSDYGAALAGAAVAEVSGKSFEALADEKILGPLGLTHTSFAEPYPARAGLPPPLGPGLATDLSDTYDWTPEGLSRAPFAFMSQRAPSGSASTTAADMSRVMELLLAGGVLDGHRIYGATAAQIMAARDQTPVGAWRHGLREIPLPGGVMGVGQEGAALTSAASLILAPSLNLGVFIAANTDTGGRLTRDLAGEIVRRFYAPPPGPPPSGSGLLAIRGDLEGVYLNDRRAFSGLEGFVDHLLKTAQVTVADDQHLVVLGSGGPETYVQLGDPGSGQLRQTDGLGVLTFLPADGEARQMIPPSGETVFERTGPLDQTRTLAAFSLVIALLSFGALADVPAAGRPSFRESSAQGRARWLQVTQALLWLIALVLFGLWWVGAGDAVQRMYGWPGLPLIIASSCALVATALAAPILLLTPFVWRGGRRVESWNGGRKLAFTLTSLIFMAYGALLAYWGALAPWSA